MELWPAIDILGGKCVRLKQGDYGRETVYGESPAAMARHWVDAGTRNLHVVDLDGAKDKEPVNRSSVLAIVREVGKEVAVEIGGGIRSEETIRDYLDLGVARVVIGTLALKEPDWFRDMSRRFPGRLVLGIDAKNGMVATEGWLETSRTPATELARSFVDLPLAALVYTDIAKDGMLEGPNFHEMAALQKVVPLTVVASGGVSTPSDIRKLRSLGLRACIIGKALYEGTMTFAEAMDASTPAPSVSAGVSS